MDLVSNGVDDTRWSAFTKTAKKASNSSPKHSIQTVWSMPYSCTYETVVWIEPNPFRHEQPHVPQLKVSTARHRTLWPQQWLHYPCFIKLYLTVVFFFFFHLNLLSTFFRFYFFCCLGCERERILFIVKRGRAPRNPFAKIRVTPIRPTKTSIALHRTLQPRHVHTLPALRSTALRPRREHTPERRPRWLDPLVELGDGLLTVGFVIRWAPQWSLTRSSIRRPSTSSCTAVLALASNHHNTNTTRHDQQHYLHNVYVHVPTIAIVVRNN